MASFHPALYPYFIPQPIGRPITLPLRHIQPLDYQTPLHSAIPSYQPDPSSVHARSLLLNQRIEHHLYRTLQANERDNRLAQEAQLGIEMNYLKRIEDLRRQRQLLNHSAYLADLSPATIVRPRYFCEGTNNISDQQLISLYQSGARGQEYLHELKTRLGKDKIGQGGHQQLLKSNGQIYEGTTGKDTIEHSKRDDRNDKSFVQRSYIDDLNNSRQLKEKDSAFKRSRKDWEQSQTIDVFARTSEESPFTRPNTKAKKRSKKGTKDASRHQNYFSTRKDTPSQQVSAPALKKINNRLKVSAIVYQDSKLRHTKHQIEHLLNTFQNEVKTRKQVRDKINNNAEILKKHKLVVESR